ncbi:MAG TPA: zeta toxin family protein, partial [Gemmatimonadaceae bacterium]|nr:zeta toxin family protein [Gemmatimonadaceae bacterium]
MEKLAAPPEGRECAVDAPVAGRSAYGAGAFPSTIQDRDSHFATFWHRPGEIRVTRQPPSGRAVRPLIIGIAGGTGSGKSTVARRVAESLTGTSVAFIDMDAYYKN